jgi:hypothetical protein
LEDSLEMAFPNQIRRRRDALPVRPQVQTYEFFEIFRNELRAVVWYDPRMSVRELFPGTLDHDFHIGLRHRLAQLPMDDVTAVTIEKAAKIVEGPADVEVW